MDPDSSGCYPESIRDAGSSPARGANREKISNLSQMG